MTGPILALEAGAFAFGSQTVFRDVDLALGRGDLVTVLGANGSGKSTLLRCLAGLLPLAAGRVHLEGAALSALDATSIARRVALLFQDHVPVLPFTVREVVTLGRTPHLGWSGRQDASDAAIVDRVMVDVGIGTLASRPYTALSGGERQLVLLARALAQEPRVLLMDEPAAHLDLANQVRCLALIRAVAARGTAVLVTTHDPNHAFVLGGRVAVLRRGEGATVGGVDDVLTSPTLSAAYGVPIRVDRERRFCSPW